MVLALSERWIWRATNRDEKEMLKPVVHSNGTRGLVYEPPFNVYAQLVGYDIDICTQEDNEIIIRLAITLGLGSYYPHWQLWFLVPHLDSLALSRGKFRLLTELAILCQELGKHILRFFSM